jgi:putative redox protein
MVNLDITYAGDLRCTATHGPSNQQLVTDAPVDNHGRGETYSPTDLVGTALGSCLLTVMGIAADARQLELKGTSVHVIKEMTVERPRRIERLTVTVTFPPAVSGGIDSATRLELQRIAENCPVRLSLSPNVDCPMQFDWQR